MGDPLNNSDGSVRGDGAQLGMSSCCREEEAPSQAIVSQWLNLASLSCTFSSYVTASTPILVCPNWLKTRFVSDSISCNGNSFFFIFVCVCVCMDKVLQPGSPISLQAYNCFGTNLAAVLFVFCVRTTSTSSQHWLYAFFSSFVSEVVFVHAKEKWQLFFLTRAILSIDPFGSATKGKACFIYIKIESRGIRFRPEQHRSSLLIFNFLVRLLYLFENRTRLLNFMFNLEVETASYNLIYNVLNNTS